MNTELLSLIGTLIGSLSGILIANRLTNYRIEQLEKKVEKHNNTVEKVAILSRDMEVANHRIRDLEEGRN